MYNILITQFIKLYLKTKAVKMKPNKLGYSVLVRNRNHRGV